MAVLMFVIVTALIGCLIAAAMNRSPGNTTGRLVQHPWWKTALVAGPDGLF